MNSLGRILEQTGDQSERQHKRTMPMSGRMQVLKRRGKSRRLQCHCGEKFWANPEKDKNVGKNENSMTARCPKCKCLWDGQDVEIHPGEENHILDAVKPTQSGRYHFRTAVQVGPDHWSPVAVGKAKHLPEYIARMALDMPRDLLGVVFSLISKEQYDHDKKYIKDQRRKYRSSGGSLPIMPAVNGVGNSGFPPIFITGKNPENTN